ncbi:MAG: hypothetical protein JNL24_09365, partial [Bacteroidia bacterium]|nr:hypothetical protein [Bacteroidia bacterium]
MRNKHLFILSFLIILLQKNIFSQEGTRTTTSDKKEISGKIMIIPFDPMMYMSEIDQKINQQTKWEFR